MFSGSVDLELIVISIVLHTFRVALALFYRPPNSPVSVFDSLLSTLYSNIDVSLFSKFVLLGDFNVNVQKTQHPLYHNVQSLLASSLCLSQIVLEPTRVTQSTCSHSTMEKFWT